MIGVYIKQPQIGDVVYIPTLHTTDGVPFEPVSYIWDECSSKNDRLRAYHALGLCFRTREAAIKFTREAIRMIWVTPSSYESGTSTIR